MRSTKTQTTHMDMPSLHTTNRPGRHSQAGREPREPILWSTMRKTRECAITHHGPIMVSNPRILLSFAPFAPLVPHFAENSLKKASASTVLNDTGSSTPTANPTPKRSTP